MGLKIFNLAQKKHKNMILKSFFQYFKSIFNKDLNIMSLIFKR